MNKNDFLPLPQVEESTIVFEEFIKIRRDTLRLPTHQTYRYYTLLTPASAVVILATTKENGLVLNEEYRHPTGKVLLGCPGGYVDQGEEPLEAAKRELIEETGYTAEEYALIGTAYPYPGISGQKIFYIHAKNAKKTAEPQREMAEIIKTIEISENEVKRKIALGCDLDGTLATALFFYGC